MKTKNFVTALALGMGAVGGAMAYLKKKANDKLDTELSDLIKDLFSSKEEESAAEIFSSKLNDILGNSFMICVENIGQCKEVIKILTLRGKVQLRDSLLANKENEEAGKDFEPA